VVCGSLSQKIVFFARIFFGKISVIFLDILLIHILIEQSLQGTLEFFQSEQG